MHTGPEIQARWLQAISYRLSEDKITAARIKRDESYTALIANTWEPILSQDSVLPNSRNRIHNSEVLVGIRHLRPPAHRSSDAMSPTLSPYQGMCVSQHFASPRATGFSAPVMADGKSPNNWHLIFVLLVIYICNCFPLNKALSKQKK
jgi:hypothetical protein